MRRVHEYTNLAKARVFYDGKGAYTFNFDKGYKLPNPYVFRGEHDSFVRFLMGIKAKDNKTWPRSVRGERYSDIADEIESGSDQIIYVWEHDFMRYINRKASKESVVKVREGRFSFADIYELITADAKKYPRHYNVDDAIISETLIQLPLLYRKDSMFIVRGEGDNDIVIAGSPETAIEIPIDSLTGFEVRSGHIALRVDRVRMQFII